jgi:hypothetical protein
MPRATSGTAVKPTPAGLIRRGFNGAVLLKQFVQHYDGNNVIAFVGTIDVLSAQEAMGFDVNSNDSNWCVRVTGAHGEHTAVVIPGCQVRMVYALPAGSEIVNRDYWRVP